MFNAIRARIAAIRTAGVRALPRAAARIEAKLRTDATTKRGNVPSYGPAGDVAIEADLQGGVALGRRRRHRRAVDGRHPEQARRIEQHGGVTRGCVAVLTGRPRRRYLG